MALAATCCVSPGGQDNWGCCLCPVPARRGCFSSLRLQCTSAVIVKLLCLLLQVYCAPTSGGKSLVAEVLMLRRIVTTQKPALLVRC